MKKTFMAAIALLLGVAVAAPAFADVEFQYGGEFRARYISEYHQNQTNNMTLDNNGYATKRIDDHNNFIDQRFRMYFNFIASQNLKVVAKFEMGDTPWGDSGTTSGGAQPSTSISGAGGRVGADVRMIEVKNLYIDFNIPCTTTNAKVGIQGINLLSSWIVDDDMSGAVLTSKLDPLFQLPISLTVGYVDGLNKSNGTDNNFAIVGPSTGGFYNQERLRVDDAFLSANYKDGPLSAAVMGFVQMGHGTDVSINPESLNTPVNIYNIGALGTGFSSERISWISGGNGFFRQSMNILAAGGNADYGAGYAEVAPGTAITGPTVGAGNADSKVARGPTVYTKSVSGANTTYTAKGSIYDTLEFSGNNLYDLGASLSYKTDCLSAYLNYAKNLGQTKIYGNDSSLAGGFYKGTDGLMHAYTATGPFSIQKDYTGWMVDAGASSYMGPATFNLGGFYTTGPKVEKNPASPYYGYVPPNQDVKEFTYPLATAKYFSEIIGGGILDNMDIVGQNLLWRGYHFPYNLWTASAGAAYQVLPKTKVSASYWYFATSEEVPTAGSAAKGDLQFGNQIGHEMDLYITQGIVDGLQLDLVGAYLIAGEAYTASSSDRNVYELGARLLWSF